MTPELDQVWKQIQGALLDRVGERTYGLWLAPLHCVSLEGDTLVLAGPPEVSAWASTRLRDALTGAATAVLGAPVEVSIEGAATTGSSGHDRGVAAAGGLRGAPAGSGELSGRAARRAAGSGLNPKYTFDHFVIGPSNRLAHAAALSVAEMPSQAYNPLFIYGPPGLGKTHLLHAVGNYVTAFGGGLSVRYATAEEFTNAFLAALAARNLEAFKHRYRDVDVLLIDDVQFLERKARTEEELFHTFNALYDAGSQMVITCDRLPGDLGDLEDRLRERFAAGLVTDIERPDPATRLAILRKRALHDGVQVTDDALALLASRVTSSVRAIEGALIRLVAYGSLTGRALDAELAADVVTRLGVALTEPRPTSITAIQEAVCAHFELTVEELLSRSRSERVVWPRQAAMYLSKELTAQSLPSIARAFAGRNHTTVLYACKRVAVQISVSPPAFADIEAITRALTETS